MDKIVKENREFRNQFGQTTLQDPTPTPRHSSSASGIAPRNENPSLVSSIAEARVPKPKAQSLLDGVTTTCPYARGFVELEHPLTMPCERVEGISQAVSLGMPTVFREQSCRTVLIREPPNGSSLSNKLSDKAVCPPHVFVHSSSPRVVPQGGNISREPPKAIRKASASEARSSPK